MTTQLQLIHIIIIIIIIKQALDSLGISESNISRSDSSFRCIAL